MGREVRRVPENWEHPKNENGYHIPLLSGNFIKAKNDYRMQKRRWDRGFIKNYGRGGWRKKPSDIKSETFEDWAGPEPRREDYMPVWPEEEKTHIQMYEDCSEGTPISPVIDTPENLARWLADNNASSFGEMTATYEQWLDTIYIGYACSAVLYPGSGVMVSGVEANYLR